ncbi:DUF3667 domain-containing protein [Flavobacterium ardleyense]|uniref:DUF3667 domain-containing protein n=1 Tax=Flavobacterium ardleyense TaxID=2038737 RepID=A0ABW5ZDS3_9FLAO
MKIKDKRFRSTSCLNCNTSLDISEKYCHSCGQLNSTKKLTIRDFFEEFFSNFYAYDSRLRNSIIYIFTKPGVLAREFNEGKHQKFANPFRLFLSVSLVLFVVINLSNQKQDINTLLAEKEIEHNIKYQREADSLAVLYGIQNNSKKDSIPFYKDSIYTKNELSEAENKTQYTITSFRNYHLKFPEKSTESSLTTLGYENNFINRTLFDKAKNFKSNETFSEILDYFYQKLPLLIFVSLPILTIMFWLVFYSKSKNYTEHLVFTYTFYTFLFLGLLIFNVLDYISTPASRFLQSISFSIVFPFYLYKSLRNFYRLSRWKTIFKFILLNFLFFPFALICILFILFLGTAFF